MSLRPQSVLPPVPEDTTRVAQTAFQRGNPYLLLRDHLGPIFADTAFADLYPARGQPAYAPWRLALVTLMQFREGLSDRQAAEAVRARIDWKYLLALDLADPGFDRSVLCEFRGGPRGAHAPPVFPPLRNLNRLELLAETLRATLNDIAVAAPDWLRVFAPPE